MACSLPVILQSCVNWYGSPFGNVMTSDSGHPAELLAVLSLAIQETVHLPDNGWMQVSVEGHGCQLLVQPLPQVDGRGCSAQQRRLEADHPAAPVACGALECPQLRTLSNRCALLPPLLRALFSSLSPSSIPFSLPFILSPLPCPEISTQYLL